MHQTDPKPDADERPDCYGTMFPDLNHLRARQVARGKVFTLRLLSAGMGTQSREVVVDDAAWEACVRCPHHRACYDLSHAKLSLWHASTAAG